jgi:hypothetical protein
MHEIIGFLLAGVSYQANGTIDRMSPYSSVGVADVCGRLGNAAYIACQMNTQQVTFWQSILTASAT